MAEVADDAVAEEKNISSTGNELTNGEANKDVVFTGKVVQVTNVSPGATLQQMATLFGFLGTVTDIRLYPTEESVQVAVKICYIKYENSEQCGVAQHLTNTVFIDKALIVVPINRDEIPEESECLHLLKTLNAYASKANSGFLPQAFPVEEVPSSIPGLPPPPVITTSVDPVEIEEIRRTIFVENIHESITSEQLMAFFSGVGEVKYLRLVKTDSTKYAFVEFSAVESVPTALQYNGVLFGNRCLKVVHAKSAISKPESERIASGRTPVRKYVEAVRKPSLERFTSRSPPRRRSRTKSPRRRRSRTRSPRRRRSRSPRRKKSRTPPRRRSRSRSKKRSKSRSRSISRDRRRRRSYSISRSRSKSPRRRRSRSRSRERRRRRRSPSRSISRSPKRVKSKKKSKSRSPSRRKSRKSLSRSPDRSSKKKKKDKDKEKNKESSKEENDTEKELDHLLTKIQNYEEEQKKTLEPGDEPKKKKKKESS